MQGIMVGRTKLRLLVVLGCLLSAGSLAGFAFAQETPAAPVPTPSSSVAPTGAPAASVTFRDGKLSVTAERADLAGLLHKVAEVIHVAIDVSPDVTGQVSVSFSDLGAEDAFKKVLEVSGRTNFAAEFKKTAGMADKGMRLEKIIVASGKHGQTPPQAMAIARQNFDALYDHIKRKYGKYEVFFDQGTGRLRDFKLHERGISQKINRGNMEAYCRSKFEEFFPFLGLTMDMFTFDRIEEDQIDTTCVYPQVVNGVPVEGAAVSVGVWKPAPGRNADDLVGFGNRVHLGIDISTEPNLTAEQAVKVAEGVYRSHTLNYDALPAWEKKVTRGPVLVIYPKPVPNEAYPTGYEYHLVWKLDFAQRTNVFIDAHSGEVIRKGAGPTPEKYFLKANVYGDAGSLLPSSGPLQALRVRTKNDGTVPSITTGADGSFDTLSGEFPLAVQLEGSGPEAYVAGEDPPRKLVGPGITVYHDMVPGGDYQEEVYPTPRYPLTESQMGSGTFTFRDETVPGAVNRQYNAYYHIMRGLTTFLTQGVVVNGEPDTGKIKVLTDYEASDMGGRAGTSGNGVMKLATTTLSSDDILHELSHLAVESVRGASIGDDETQWAVSEGLADYLACRTNNDSVFFPTIGVPYDLQDPVGSEKKPVAPGNDWYQDGIITSADWVYYYNGSFISSILWDLHMGGMADSTLWSAIKPGTTRGAMPLGAYSPEELYTSLRYFEADPTKLWNAFSAHGINLWARPGAWDESGEPATPSDYGAVTVDWFAYYGFDGADADYLVVRKRVQPWGEEHDGQYQMSQQTGWVSGGRKSHFIDRSLLFVPGASYRYYIYPCNAAGDVLADTTNLPLTPPIVSNGADVTTDDLSVLVAQGLLGIVDEDPNTGSVQVGWSRDPMTSGIAIAFVVDRCRVTATGCDHDSVAFPLPKSDWPPPAGSSCRDLGWCWKQWDYNLPDGNTYRYSLTSFNVAGRPCDTYLDETIVNHAPPAPEPATAAFIGSPSSQIMVTWTIPTQYPNGRTVADLNGFEIWRAEGTGDYVQVTTATAAAKEYRDPNAVEGRIYRYEVLAVDIGGGRSAPAFADTVPPPPPTSVHGSGADNGQMQVCWTAPTNPDGSPVADLGGYRLYRRSLPPDTSACSLGKKTLAGVEFCLIQNNISPGDLCTIDADATSDKVYYYALLAFDFALNESTPVMIEAAPALDVALVIDRSGSMALSAGSPDVRSRIQVANGAATAFLALLGDENRKRSGNAGKHRAGIISFGNDASNSDLALGLRVVDATTMSDFTSIFPKGVLERIESAVTVNPEWTNVTSGIEGARFLFDPDRNGSIDDTNRASRILLLSDGFQDYKRCTVASPHKAWPLDDPLQYVQPINGGAGELCPKDTENLRCPQDLLNCPSTAFPSAIQIHTIGLGSEVQGQPLQVLKDLATTTNGRFHDVSGLSGLSLSAKMEQVYIDMLTHLTGGTNIFWENAPIASNQTRTESVDIDSSVREATFIATWADANASVDLVLKAPDGHYIDPTAAAASGGAITYVKGKTYQFYAMDAPAAGRWEMTMTASSSTSYSAMVIGKSFLEMSLDFGKIAYVKGDAITVSVKVVEPDGTLVKGASITGYMNSPTNSNEITLNDLGQGGDQTAGDGEYTGTYVATSAGAYTFSLRASGQNSHAEAFTREQLRSIYVASSSGPEAPQRFAATSGNGLIDLAWVNPVGLNVAGIKVVRTVGNYPANAESGETVCDGLLTSCRDAGRTNGTRYYYTAFAYDTNGVYSLPEEGCRDSATPSATDTTPPQPVRDFMAIAGDGRVTLFWTNPLNSDFDHVLILRSAGACATSCSDPTATLFTPAPDATSFIDTTAANGATYCYAIFAVDIAGNCSGAGSGSSGTATPKVPVAPAAVNDPFYSMQWHLNNEGQSGGKVDADIDAPEAWAIEEGSNQIVIAIVDSGVDYTHPDLAFNMWHSYGQIQGDGGDEERYVDDVYGHDFTGNEDGDPKDENGHGTHVAGIADAVANNGIGVAGVARSANHDRPAAGGQDNHRPPA